MKSKIVSSYIALVEQQNGMWAVWLTSTKADQAQNMFFMERWINWSELLHYVLHRGYLVLDTKLICVYVQDVYVCACSAGLSYRYQVGFLPHPLRQHLDRKVNNVQIKIVRYDSTFTLGTIIKTWLDERYSENVRNSSVGHVFTKYEH